MTQQAHRSTLLLVQALSVFVWLSSANASSGKDVEENMKGLSSVFSESQPSPSHSVLLPSSHDELGHINTRMSSQQRRMSCNGDARYYFEPQTHECILRCPYGQYFNVNVQSCVQKCDEGQTNDNYGICRPDFSHCEPGEVYDSIFGGCRLACAWDQTSWWNGQNSYCSPRCREDQVKGNAGVCVPGWSPCGSAGQVHDASLNDCRQACEFWQSYDVSFGRCLGCRDGEHMDRSGECHVACGDSETFDASLGRCRPVCTSDQTFDASLGRCREVCAADQTFDYTIGGCVCPEGQQFLDGECRSPVIPCDQVFTFTDYNPGNFARYYYYFNPEDDFYFYSKSVFFGFFTYEYSTYYHPEIEDGCFDNFWYRFLAD